MRFPYIKELTTTNIKTISIDDTIDNAVSQMINSEHRNLIVEGDTTFKILNVHDVIRIKNMHINSKMSLRSLDLIELPTIHKEANILDALDCLQGESQLIAVLEDDKSLFGIVTHSDIISSMDPDVLMENYRLRDFVKGNKHNRWIDSSIPCDIILGEMSKYQHESAIILDQRKPIGILTTKDILHLLQAKKDLSLPIETYMSQPVECIHYESTIKQALEFMRNKHFKRIVTIDEHGDLVGVLTEKELVSITYSRWAILMKEYQKELSEINDLLEKKSRKYEKIAGTDPLTGLYNRMKFMELYLAQYRVMTQRQNPMALMMVDLDHFKRINDQYGHNIGDKVLKQTSNILLQSLRNVDILCRWGGEEFVALLPTANADQAITIANQIRIKLEQTHHDDIPSITASFGITQIHEGDDIETTIGRADKALYEAKESGRNCVISI